MTKRTDEPKKMGRPTLYTDELGDEICSRCMTRAVHSVMKDADMPSEQTFYNWLQKHADFFEKYVRAREIRAFRRTDNIDKLMALIHRKRVAPDAGRVMLDAMKWQAGRENSQLSDRLNVNQTGNTVLQITHRVMEIPDKPPSGDSNT